VEKKTGIHRFVRASCLVQALGEMADKGIPVDRTVLELAYKNLSRAIDSQVEAFVQAGEQNIYNQTK